MLGTGIGQIIFILIIMLIVAGPKRMMQWAYILGQYLAKFRAIYADTITVINKELQSTGLELPKDPALLKPKMFDVVSEAGKVLSGVATQAAATTTPTTAPTAPTPTAAPEPTSTPAPITPASEPSLTLSSESENTDGDQKKYDAWIPKE